MDCPACDGRIVFRSSNPRFRGATTGRCGLCRTRFAIAGGHVQAIEAGERGRWRHEPTTMAGVAPLEPTASVIRPGGHDG